MQDLAHLVVNGREILVLRRPVKNGVALKLRKSGPKGQYLEDESAYLSLDDEQCKQTLTRLLCGEVILL